MALIIWPVQNVKLIGWSAGKELPEADSFYTERPLYFVTYFYGSFPFAASSSQPVFLCA